ncbi:MAG: thioredoxin family protein [Dehalococcoidia bacterium]
MASETSVVTPERFATGIGSFKEWMAAIGQRQTEFQRHYDEYDPKPEDVEYFKKAVAEHGVKALVLGEDWCPDVWRGLPTIAKLAEQAGMEVRYFMRDQNKDIMSEFLNQGEFESIPTIVFYDKNHKYLGHWIERPVLAQEEMPKIRAQVLPNPMPERDTPEYAAAMDASREAMIVNAGPWRHAEIEEIREFLDAALN